MQPNPSHLVQLTELRYWQFFIWEILIKYVHDKMYKILFHSKALLFEKDIGRWWVSSPWRVGRVRKSENFPGSKIFHAKTLRIKRVNRDIFDFAAKVLKTCKFHVFLGNVQNISKQKVKK